MLTETLPNGLVKKEMKKYKVTGMVILDYEVPVLADSKEQAIQSVKEKVSLTRYSDGTCGLVSDLQPYMNLEECEPNIVYLLDETNISIGSNTVLSAEGGASIVHYERSDK